jgi:hypothetical protein
MPSKLNSSATHNSSVYHDTTTVSLLWNVVQSTQSFLARSNFRIDWNLSRLRRYFCHIVEQLFSVIPNRSFLTLYRLMEEWFPFGSLPAFRERRAAVETRSVPQSEAHKIVKA